MRSSLRVYGGNLKSFGNINLYYDLSGRRIKKVNGNKVTHYLYDEQGRLLREKFDGSDVPYITYLYDSSGAVGFMLPYAVYDLGQRHINERPFYYVKDLTGNIRQIVDSNGKCVIKYDYDAWGRVISAEYSDTRILSILFGKTPTLMPTLSVNLIRLSIRTTTMIRT